MPLTQLSAGIMVGVFSMTTIGSELILVTDKLMPTQSASSAVQESQNSSSTARRAGPAAKQDKAGKEYKKLLFASRRWFSSNPKY